MTTASTFAATVGAGFVRHTAATVLAVGNIVYRWYRCERDLRHVMQLDGHLLRDVGLTRDQVLRDRLRLYAPR